MLSFTVLTCASALLGVPADPDPLASIAYRDVFLGKVQSAARQYEELYLSAPSTGRTLDLRMRAAFRAGKCFQSLGMLDSARLAYDWILEHESPATPSFGASRRTSFLAAGPPPSAEEGGLEATVSETIVSEAGWRLRALRSRSVMSPEDAATGAALSKLVAACNQSQGKLHAARVTLESELEIQRERLTERTELLQRLERGGVLLRFPEDTPVPKDVVVRPLAGALGGGIDVSRFLETTAGRLYEDALRSLEAGNWLAARTDLRIVESMAPRNRQAAAWLALLWENELRPAQAAALARRQILDGQLSRTSSLRRKIRRLLEDARALMRDRGRPDLAVSSLHEIRALLDWARPSMRQQPEVRDLSFQANRLLGALARNSRARGRLWRSDGKIRADLEASFFLAAELVRVLARQVHLERPGTLKGREVVLACRAELDRLLYQARQTAERSDRVTLQRLLRDATTLLEWVPETDTPRGAYREALLALQRSNVEKRPTAAEDHKAPTEHDSKELRRPEKPRK